MTEPASDPAASSGWRPRTVPVRLRITAAVVALTGLALAGAGFVVFVLQEQRLDRGVDQSINRELTRFSALEASKDPQDNGTARRLLMSAIQSSVPQPSEAVVLFVDGVPTMQSGDGIEDPRGDQAFVDEVGALIDTGGTADVETGQGTVRIAVKAVRDDVTDGAIVYAYSLDKIDAELRDVMGTYTLVAVGSLFVVAFGAYVVSGRLLRPIRDLRDAARDISESDLTRRITATGHDDLTDLTVTFNDMLDRLEAAFSTQRQFLDDVGHELKTPITIVRGHLEVLDTDDVQEVDTTRELVLDELDRMGRLVGDLILLAKTRRPDFVHLERTDLGALTDILVDKTRGLADRDWRLDDRADAWVLADSQRLTQAVLQLAANAVRHTRDGEVVAVGSSVVGRTALLWVRDAGEGIEAGQQARIFERFRRATAEGDGSGLGLAIVRGIAEAHGGEVRLESARGDGATFTISFPAHEESARSTR